VGQGSGEGGARTASTAHPPRSPAGALSPAVLGAVAAGGALGTLLRAALDAAMPNAATGFAASTLLVNVIGAAALGVLVGWASPRVPGWARAGLGTGLLGAFTTYSAFAVSVVLLADGERLAGAIMSVALTLVLGLGAAVAGHVIGERLARDSRLAPGPWPEVDE
jgi:CrcB protein